MILRPVLEGCLDMADLYGTRLSLADVMLLNDALDVRAENELRWAERNRG